VTSLLARLLLAGVFGVAGTAKLADRAGARRMVVGFGSPEAMASALVWVLVCSELGIAVALLLAPSSRHGGWGALALLLAFGAAAAINLANGRRPECRCFGSVRAHEVGWSTVARNALLASVAGFVATGSSLPLVLAPIAAATWMALASRAHGRPRPGMPAPALSLVDQAGGRSTLSSLLADRRAVLLVFGESACGACQELMPRVADWQQRLDRELAIAVVSAGSPEGELKMARDHGLRTVLVDEDHRASTAYGITATPSAVLIDAQARVVAMPARGADEIAALVELATATGEQPPVGRRVVLRSAAAGAAAVTLIPLYESAAAIARTVAHAVRPTKLKIDGAWVCGQRYALCTFAACKPSKTNPDISVCKCKVKTGYSVGFKSCEKRAPKGRQLHSNFSLQDVTNRTRSMKCSKRGLWVQCLDVVCEVDSHNPKHASCQCVNQRTKNFYTFGGDCRTETCNTVIWSATTAPFPGGAQLEKGLKRLGIPFKVPKGCPPTRPTS
jgi:peroxiredoxin